MSEPLRSDTSTHAARPATGRMRIALAALAVFAFATLLYLPTLRNGFVWDDLDLIANPDLHALDGGKIKHLFTSNYWEVVDPTVGLYRPLTALSLATDYRLHAEKPAGFHLTNVLVNAAASSLLLLVIWELFGSLAIALIAALFFAAFPMHTENVAWISGRTDLFATLFMLASMWFYARWRWSGNPTLLAGVLLGFVAALLAKETAIVFPAVIAVTEMLRLGRERPRGERTLGIVTACVLGIIAVLYLVLRKQVLGASLVSFHRFTHGPLQAVAFSFSILAHYAYKLLFPFRLRAEADFPPPAGFADVHALAGLVVAVAAGCALWIWRRHAAFVFGMAVIVLGLAPVLNIVPANQVLAERFLYFPSVGFALLVALGVAALRSRWRLPVTVAFALLLAACSARTIMRSFDWKDELTLFQKTVAESGNNARARASLGSALFKRERYEEAQNQFRFAVRLNPSYAPGWSGLAKTEARLGDVKQAVDDLQNALELEPDNTPNISLLGNLQFQARDYMSAVGAYQEVLRRRPGEMQVRFNLGLSFYQLGFFDDAVREFSALENKDRDFPNAWFFIAESESRRGHADQAAQAATHFLSLHNAEDAMTSRAREIAAGGH